MLAESGEHESRRVGIVSVNSACMGQPVDVQHNTSRQCTRYTASLWTDRNISGVKYPCSVSYILFARPTHQHRALDRAAYVHRHSIDFLISQRLGDVCTTLPHWKSFGIYTLAFIALFLIEVGLAEGSAVLMSGLGSPFKHGSSDLQPHDLSQGSMGTSESAFSRQSIGKDISLSWACFLCGCAAAVGQMSVDRFAICLLVNPCPLSPQPRHTRSCGNHAK